MMNRVLAIGGMAALMFAFAVVTPTAGARPLQPPPSPAAAQVPPQRALLDRYCLGCHSQPAKAAGQEPARKLTLDDLDVARVAAHADVWERVVRKMRAGMMPPAGARRPDKATYDGVHCLAGERAGSRRRAVHAAARAAPPEPHRIRQRHPRPARPRDRSRRSTCRPTIRRTASTTSPARSAFPRRWSRPTSRRRGRSAAWRSASRRRPGWSSIERRKTRRRTTTSKGCRSARAAACS